MKKVKFFFAIIAGVLFLSLNIQAQSFTMKAVTSYPFPRDITSSAKGSKIAMTIEEEGIRNIYVAEGPLFNLRKLTSYTKDNGQELTSVSISDDGQWVVYVKGGEHSGNRDRSMILNPELDATPPKIQVWTIKFAGGKPNLLGDGDYAVPSPKGDRVAWINEDKVWMAKMDGNEI